MAPITSQVILPQSMRGALTVSIDMEDWHQLVMRKMTGHLPPCSNFVEQQTNRVLEVLEESHIRATFFVLGLVARERPDLVKRIADRGHEIASHGVQHIPLQLLTRDEVRADLHDSRALLSDLIGQDVVGFRAPEFSIVDDNRWVLEELAAAGYRYDSSIFPIAHRRYGIRTFPRGPSRIQFGSTHLWELPLGTIATRLGNLPVSGGGYFRLLPGRILEEAIRSITTDGETVMLYFHPYEFTDTVLRLDPAAMPTGSARLRAEVWLALQALGRSRLPNRARRAMKVARSIRAVDLVDALDAIGRPHDVGN